jgi:Cu/Ag efflux pump CusA
VVLLVAAALFAWGIYSVRQNPIDAIPDLSENQVIVFTEWMGRSPQVIEDQVTYPLVSNLQGIPKVKNIRGSSMFGMSFVYVIFEDNVDIYWARTRVLERLNFAQRLLPLRECLRALTATEVAALHQTYLCDPPTTTTAATTSCSTRPLLAPMTIWLMTSTRPGADSGSMVGQL